MRLGAARLVLTTCHWAGCFHSVHHVVNTNLTTGLVLPHRRAAAGAIATGDEPPIPISVTSR
jgi:hypothetical protein